MASKTTVRLQSKVDQTLHSKATLSRRGNFFAGDPEWRSRCESFGCRATIVKLKPSSLKH